MWHGAPTLLMVGVQMLGNDAVSELSGQKVALSPNCGK